MVTLTLKDRRDAEVATKAINMLLGSSVVECGRASDGTWEFCFSEDDAQDVEEACKRLAAVLTDLSEQ
jgi:hypothetical protein